MNKKIGRNDPCPCGSNKKYKRCHGSIVPPATSIPINLHDIKLKIAQIEAKRKRIEDQQGMGRKIISANIADKTVIAVGNSIYYSDKYKTFHDFLPDYLISILGKEWFNVEYNKPYNDRHEILKWYTHVQAYHKKIVKQGEISSAPFIGAVEAFLRLAYDLYDIKHNKWLQDRLIHRIKNPDLFPGAYNETISFACLIRAGFEIEFEDETGAAGKRTECIATCSKSNNKYSVEVKSVHRSNVLGNKNTFSKQSKSLKKILAEHLRDAFNKKSDHPRIIFLELNMPTIKESEELTWPKNVLHAVRNKEEVLQAKDSAYLIITNNPCHRYLEQSAEFYKKHLLFLGFRIHSFGYGSTFNSLVEYHYVTKKHSDIIQLKNSIEKHRNIPATLDGEVEAFAFKKQPEPRFMIGNSYWIPDQNGNDVAGVLTKALVMEESKICFGIYWVPEMHSSIIATTPITDNELAAYKQHPETFFGVYQEINKPITDIFGMFDFYFRSFSQATKERLLELLVKHPQIDKLRNMDQEMLAATYCEILALNSWNNK